MIGRLDLWRMQLSCFRQSPIFGVDPGRLVLESLNTDTGFANTIVLYGIVGLVAVIILVIAIFKQAHHLVGSTSLSEGRELGLAMLGATTGMVALYGFALNYFTTLSVMVSSL